MLSWHGKMVNFSAQRYDKKGEFGGIHAVVEAGGAVATGGAVYSG